MACSVRLLDRQWSGQRGRWFRLSTRIPGSSILERRAAKLKPAAFKKPVEEPNRKAPEASTA
jgi:hypothetical protein